MVGVSSATLLLAHIRTGRWLWLARRISSSSRARSETSCRTWCQRSLAVRSTRSLWCVRPVSCRACSIATTWPSHRTRARLARASIAHRVGGGNASWGKGLPMAWMHLPLHHHHLRSGLSHHHHLLLLLLLCHLPLLLLLLHHLARMHLTLLLLHHLTLLHHLPRHWLVHLLLVRRPHRHSIYMACWSHKLAIWPPHHHALRRRTLRSHALAHPWLRGPLSMHNLAW